MNEEQLETFKNEWVNIDVVHSKYGKVRVVDADYMGRLTLMVASQDFHGLMAVQVPFTEVNKAA